MTNDEYQEAIADMAAHHMPGSFLMPSPLCEVWSIPEGAEIISYTEMRERLTAHGLPKTLIIRVKVSSETPQETEP